MWQQCSASALYAVLTLTPVITLTLDLSTSSMDSAPSITPVYPILTRLATLSFRSCGWTALPLYSHRGPKLSIFLILILILISPILYDHPIPLNQTTATFLALPAPLEPIFRVPCYFTASCSAYHPRVSSSPILIRNQTMKP